MYFVSIYENKRMKPVEIVLRTGGEEKRKNDGGGKSNLDLLLAHILNMTVYPPVQQLYDNKIIKNRKVALSLYCGNVNDCV
jgi:hypothetical protein